MKARLGQHFLVSPTAPRAIIAAAGDLQGRVILEIGPGRGAITTLLAKAATRLVAVEFDRDLAQSLLETYSSRADQIDIITNDILRVNLTALAAREGSRLIVIGNLPYYITSEILLHLYAHAPALDRAVLMIQKEVADRLCAPPCTREYGLLTVTTQLYATIERLFELTPADFSPAPEVHSTVVRLNFAPQAATLAVDPAAFLAFLRTCFALKRKTIGNNLRAASYPPPRLEAAFAATSISREARAEALSLAQLASLWRALS